MYIKLLSYVFRLRCIYVLYSEKRSGMSIPIRSAMLGVAF